MARADVTVKLNIEARDLEQALDRLLIDRAAVLRRTLTFLRDHPRTSPRSYAMVAWPEAWGKGGRALHGASGNAAQRLRAAVKAGLAHVAFEQGEETYEISARGLAAIRAKARRDCPHKEKA